MIKNKHIHTKFASCETLLDKIILNFEKEGREFGNQDRNTLKLFDVDGMTINVKSFKIPNVINQIVYRFFRKSKAQRSYEYANKLIEFGIGTPQPIAYYEFVLPLIFKKSYYVSEHQDYDLTYRELTTNFDYPEYDSILRAFTRFTFQLHEKGILFLDHSPGNTLIKKQNSVYHFFLVDLNRMKFKPLSFEERIKNFSRLTIHESMVKVMSDEYSKCIGESFERVFNLMWKSTNEFQDKFHRKRRLKKKLKFWKSND